MYRYVYPGMYLYIYCIYYTECVYIYIYMYIDERFRNFRELILMKDSWNCCFTFTIRGGHVTMSPETWALEG